MRCSSLHRGCVAVLSALGVAGLAAPASAQSAGDETPPPLQLKAARALGEARGTGPDSARAGMPTFVRAQRVTGLDKQQATLEGDAELRRDGVVLRGDRIEYTYETDRIDADGHVRLFQNGVLLTGPSLDYKIEASTGSMPQAEFRYQGRDVRGSADSVEFLGPDRLRMTNAIITTCGPGDESWWIRAERLTMDQQDEAASADSARLYFEGVPILVAPWFEFPLGERRRSGLLTPGFYANSRLGPEIDTPYYFNIAANRDLTVTPTVIPQRGVLASSEFRFLEPRWRGVLDYDVMPQDRVFGGMREFVGLQGDWAGMSGFAANINYNRVSDDNFFVDFSRTATAASQAVLPQTGYVAYNSTYWSTAVHVNRDQPLYSLLAAAGETAPYEQVPDLVFNAVRSDWHGLDLASAVDFSRFVHPTLQQGTRLLLNPSVSLPLQAPGYFVVPKLQWHYTQYQLDSASDPVQPHPTRSLPIASLDAGLVFEREASWFGTPSLQTLEPRLFYARIPYRDQSNLPNFDSGLADFNFAQLFTENVYSGNDRIGEANQLTAALVGKLIDPETGAERLRAAVGERFYFSPQRVTLPGGAERTDKSSDLLVSLTGLLARRWVGDMEVEYSSSQNQFVRATAGIRWQPRAASTVSLSYRYNSGLVDPTQALNQIDFAAQWPLTKRLYGVAHLNYSVRDRAWVEQLTGAEYRADCWVFRFALQRYVTTSTTTTSLASATSTTTFFIQLELNGVTSVGTSPLDQLRRNIPGYQMIGPPVRSVGPYDDYE